MAQKRKELTDEQQKILDEAEADFNRSYDETQVTYMPQSGICAVINRLQSAGYLSDYCLKYSQAGLLIEFCL